MAKNSGSKKSNKSVKKTSKKPAKKGPSKIEKLLKEISQRNQTILKEARKIDDLLRKAPKPLTAVAEQEPLCPPETGIMPNGNG
jgi:hypothetical protein